jgi:hypothetical protein
MDGSVFASIYTPTLRVRSQRTRKGRGEEKGEKGKGKRYDDMSMDIESNTHCKHCTHIKYENKNTIK